VLAFAFLIQLVPLQNQTFCSWPVFLTGVPAQAFPAFASLPFVLDQFLFAGYLNTTFYQVRSSFGPSTWSNHLNLFISAPFRAFVAATC
jgi:hypothetical protein